MAKLTLIIACCLLVLVNVFAARSDKEAMMEKIIADIKECQAEVGATDADFEDLIQKKPAAGMEGKCLRACILKKMGLMDANGKLVKSAALEFVKKCADGDADKLQKMTAVIEVCTESDYPSNACEAAEQYKNCIWEKTTSM